MTARSLSLFLVLIAVVALASAAERASPAELNKRAEAAAPAEQVKLYLELAELQLKAADDFYNQGNVEGGKAAVEQTADACEKAGNAARKSGKHMKNTEIHLRDLQRKMDAIRRTVSFDDRATLQNAIDRLEKVRSDLLFAMFGTKA